MSDRVNKRLRAISLGLNPYQTPTEKVGNWRRDEWLRGFEGLPFLGHLTTIQFDVYNEGKAAFTRLTKGTP